jgi:hypothetical protein
MCYAVLTGKEARKCSRRMLKEKCMVGMSTKSLLNISLQTMVQEETSLMPPIAVVVLETG